MGNFHYRARSKRGELLVGELQASDIHEAALRIREKGLWVVGLEEEVPMLSWRESLKGILFKEINIPGLSTGLGRKEELLFLSQLSSMVQAGLPLQQALCAMEKYGEKVSYQNLKKQMEQDVTSGRQLHEAMGRYPEVFSQTVRTCVKAGEQSGSLGEILRQLSLHLKNSLKAREKLKSALIYPAILLTMMVLSMFVVAAFVLPTFANLLGNIQGEIPWATVVLLETADFLGTFRGQLFLLGALVFMGLVVATAFKEPRCRLWLDKALLGMPSFGSLAMHSEWQQILGTLGVLLRSGIQLSEALQMVASVPDNRYLRDCLVKIHSKAEQGQPLTASLALCSHVPWQARELLAAGEQVGRLEEMLFESSDICREQAVQESERLLVLVEPALTLILGAILLFLVMAVIMPVLNVMDALV